MSAEPIFNELVKDPFFARKSTEKANNRCILTKDSFKKDLNAEYVHQVFKLLKNYEITEWLHTRHICLPLDVNSAGNFKLTLAKKHVVCN